MTKVSTWKVVGGDDQKAMFYGSWEQCVKYAIRQKLGTYNEYGWLGHALKMRDGYEIKGA